MHLKNDKRGESPKAGGQAVPDEELDFGTLDADALAALEAEPRAVFDRGVHIGTTWVDPTDSRRRRYFRPRSVFVRAPDDGDPYPMVERPDWDYWALIPMLTVHEAAAIACDIAPEYFSKSEDAREFDEFHKDVIRHRRLLPTALSHIESGALEVVSGKVRAEVFAAWANGLGWKPPARFPRKAACRPDAAATDQLVALKSRPLQATIAQEDAILAALKQMKSDPLAMPRGESGRSGLKAAVRVVIGIPSPLFQSKRVFDKAWERLLASRRMSYDVE